VAVDEWVVTFGTAMTGWTGPQPAWPFLAVPKVKAHPSTASVPITMLLCGFNVPVKELNCAHSLTHSFQTKAFS